MPKPDPSLFEPEVETSAETAVTQNENEFFAGYGNPYFWGEYPIGTWDYLTGGDELDRLGWREDFRHDEQPAPAVRHARYNLLEYNASLVDWQREHGRQGAAQR